MEDKQQAGQGGVPPPLKGLSPCDVEALKRCLEKNSGDQSKCEAEVLAFQRACSREGGGAPGAAPGLRPSPRS
ncbi:MAG: hypothetical protein J3K34DRAFT_401274 [Monoraphidium minutum]|nr:MAG: hypothetical protein J3K34DRAFT_401274 [Monoraphidium minutum]